MLHPERLSKLALVVAVSLLLGLAFGGLLSLAAPSAAPQNTVITVTSGGDGGGLTEGCDDVAASECTLRRAINQARSVPAQDRPVTIQFALPITDPTYSAGQMVWVIDITSTNSSSEQYAFRDFTGGNITIDGETQASQAGARPFSEGPSVILRGDNDKGAFNLSSSDNVIRGLAFQRFGDNVVILPSGVSNSTIEDNWFGLTISGTGVFARDDIPQPTSRAGEAGVFVQSGADGNTIQRNNFIGYLTEAINVQSDNNQILSNTIGARVDGTIPYIRPERVCQGNAAYDNWFGGKGIFISGANNLAQNNRLVGLDGIDPAFEVSGVGHQIQANIIGVESNGEPFGVCGRGISVIDTSGIDDVEILTNTIVNARSAAGIFINGTRNTYDNAVMQSNVITGGLVPPVDFGATVPAALKEFEPAAITSWSGTSVSGTAGQDSPCANCVVELFLDDHDTLSETLESLAIVTADANGDWSATLPRTLALDEGIRTASTTVSDGQIANPGEGVSFEAGTTTKLSTLYLQDGAPDPTPPVEEPPLPPEPLPTLALDYPTPPPMTPVTTITVRSTSDAGGMSERCSDSDVPAGECTLRRAVNQALSESTPKPVLIAFDLPLTDTNYDAENEVWYIYGDSGETTDINFMYRTVSGQTIIDGSTQPIGRDLADGPRVILRGDNDQGAFTLTSGENVVRWLGFQGFGDNVISVSSGGNLVEENWIGLTTDGQEVYLRSDRRDDGSGEGGIFVTSGANANLIQNNTLLGLRAKAINVQGSFNWVRANYIGLQAGGTVPNVSAARVCKPNALFGTWYAGAGMRASGWQNIIGGPNPADGNRVVGLLFSSADPLTTPDNAIDITGSEHLVQYNIIGRTVDGEDFGTCGRGLVIGSDYTDVLSNTVINAHIEALGIYGTINAINSVTMMGNQLINDLPLNPNPPEGLNSNAPIVFGTTVPVQLKTFTPSQVITFSDSLIAGSNYEGADCPYCRLELFLDDTDPVTDAMESLGHTQSDVDGNWSFTLSEPIPLTRGVRVQNTTLNYGTVQNFDAGTSSRLSELYTQTGSIAIDPPAPPPISPPEPLPEPEPIPPAPTAPITYGTVITVTSGADPDDDKSTTCYTTPGVGQTVGDVCTLRRALIEAGDIPTSQRPVLISFDLGTDDPAYEAETETWVIELTQTLELNALPNMDGGSIVLDGATQPLGRDLAEGPRIFLRGPVPYKTGIVVNGLNNVVREMGFQRFNNQVLQLNSGQNIIEDNWFGLTTDGQEIFLRNALEWSSASGLSGVNGSNTSNQNLIQNNVFVGFLTKAIDMEGAYNRIRANLVGTRADGTLPEIAANRKCESGARYFNWFAGGGIQVSGVDNLIGGDTPADGNRIVGLLYASGGAATPDNGITTNGTGHLIQNNIIGITSDGVDYGTCGRGMSISSAQTRILSNTVINTGLESLGLYGGVVNTLHRYNTLRESYVEFEFGPTVPSGLRNFTPTQVITIDGTLVEGAPFDEASVCPYCELEIYVDDYDDKPETLATLDVITMDVDGRWSYTLAEPLAMTEGLRTANTSLDYGIFGMFDAGNTTYISELFQPPGAPTYVPPTPESPFGPPPAIPEPVYREQPSAPESYATTITINTTDGANSSDSCLDTPSDCSLIKAINQASETPLEERPVLIEFNIPDTDPGYNASGWWKIDLASTSALVLEGGHITLDGTSQPNARPDGPAIVIERASIGGADLQLGEMAGEGSYVVRGLALQNVEISMTGLGNIVENNWLGLTSDGTDIYFYNDSPSNDNRALIYGASTSQQNLVRDNTLVGSRSNGLNFQGDYNFLIENRLGTLPNGLVPQERIAETSFCRGTQTSDNWFGGGGMVLPGAYNQVLSNTIAGLLMQGSATNTPPDAILVSGGEFNLLQGNRIGQNEDGSRAFTCGRGLHITAPFITAQNNVIADTVSEAILINDTDVLANAFYGNIISYSTVAFSYGPTVPPQLVNFNPALVTVIDGTTVSGISDDPCPYCRVDVYVDNLDRYAEALEHFGHTFADADGNWSLTLPRPLTADEALRTTSTTRDFGVVAGFEAFSTSSLSSLFKNYPPTAPVSVTLTVPSTPITVSTAALFVADTFPVSTTIPVTYVWQATGLAPVTQTGGLANDVSLMWDSPGAKVVTVTARNAYGEQSASQSISVIEAVEPAPDQPVTGLNLSGPATGEIGLSYDFTALVSPADATQPITFRWQATDQSDTDNVVSGASDTLSLTWAQAGTKLITVTADNGFGVVTETHEIQILSEGEAIAIDSVSLSRSPSGTVQIGDGVSIQAQVSPAEASLPITYTWQATQVPSAAVRVITATQDAVTIQWPTAGPKVVTVTVVNAAGVTQQDVLSLTVTASTEPSGFVVHLPLVLK